MFAKFMTILTTATVVVRCPHCGKSQRRARHTKTGSYACFHCKKRFTRGTK